MCIEKPTLEVIDAGRVAYRDMLTCQERLFDEAVARKKENEPVEKEYLILVEHYPVFTLGRHGKEGNLLVSESILNSKGIELVHIGRGGDITYHGPGQLVVYPIIDIQAHSMGVKQYIYNLEEVVIRVLNEYGIKGERVEHATGVWIGKGTEKERKICAIGVKCRRFVTMHGLALNVNTDLTYFSAINPCGFVDKGVTSIAKELKCEVQMDEVKRQFVSCFKEVFK